ncbi:N-formylglutamate deformylase [Pseudaminobacter sp. 19-2017]|uniref:N-formylglutamate deformylase n=1 Tax=Pseudaminobacter soli (ex Zhang et al. 2022) TaxID=2831468 RepID=A0A942DY40_9HYPH|nr:N-formylglutamate deformylase [Pseudaminobacter soli]MBS3649528.1 N-formylglutamate deformylase [Pseudaminobacter soli]
MTPVEVRRGASPVILAFPHVGTFVPSEIAARLNEEGQKLRDTDWHVDRLYEGLLPDATTVRATFHRYVVDANRDPSGKSLYPGQNTTGLVPLTDFDNQAIWIPGQEPSDADIEERVARFHAPYHAALAAEIERVKDENGVAILYDCHSIRSVCPFLFEGVLPDFNIGTNDGTSCDPAIETVVREVCASATSYTHVLNGRFKGGWTTRHYGRPHEGVHAIQMELAQITHLVTEALPFQYDDDKAAQLRRHLRAALEELELVATRLAAARN